MAIKTDTFKHAVDPGKTFSQEFGETILKKILFEGALLLRLRQNGLVCVHFL